MTRKPKVRKSQPITRAWIQSLFEPVYARLLKLEAGFTPDVEAETEIEFLRDVRRSQALQILDMNDRLSKLSGERNKALADIEHLEQRCKGLDQSLSELSQANAKLVEERAHLDTQNTALLADFQALQRQLRTNQGYIARLQQLREEADAKLRNEELTIADLRTDLTIAREQLVARSGQTVTFGETHALQPPAPPPMRRIREGVCFENFDVSQR